MRFYIAAKYSRRYELRDLVAKIEALGHECTAQWINNGEEGKDIQAAAIMDVEDVRRADTLIFIGEPQGTEVRGGGRWFEFGLAYALNKRCIALISYKKLENLGDRVHLPFGHESVFTALPHVQIAMSEHDLLDML